MLSLSPSNLSLDFESSQTSDRNSDSDRSRGQTLDRIEKDPDRDRFMSSAEAMAYGLIDKVVETANVR